MPLEAAWILALRARDMTIIKLFDILNLFAHLLNQHF